MKNSFNQSKICVAEEHFQTLFLYYIKIISGKKTVRLNFINFTSIDNLNYIFKQNRIIDRSFDLPN